MTLKKDVLKQFNVNDVHNEDNVEGIHSEFASS